MFAIVPIAFQGTRAPRHARPGIYDGSGVAAAWRTWSAACADLALIVLLLLLARCCRSSLPWQALPAPFAGVGRWLVAALPLACERPRRADASDVDRSGIQSDPAVDVGLRLRAGGIELLLSDLQFPQSQCRMDASARQPESASALACAEPSPCSRCGACFLQCVSARCRRECLRQGGASDRARCRGDESCRCSRGVIT